MRIDFLYFADCPSHEDALARLRDVLDKAGVQAEMTITEVTDEEMAETLCFLGSPTIRINGHDVEPDAVNRQDYGLTCRAYTRPDGRITPLPPRELLQSAVRRATQG